MVKVHVYQKQTLVPVRIKTQMNTIVPDLKVSKIHQRDTPTRYAQSSPITLYLLSKNQSRRKRALQEYRLGF